MTTLFIGLGRMGAPMVRNYAAHFDTVLFDAGPVAAELSGELQVPALDSLAELPSTVDTVVLMVPSSAAVEELLTGTGRILEQLQPGALVIDMGSSVPASTRALAAEARGRSVGYVDAPVSGGSAKAAAGTLSAMVGGDPADIARARAHIDAMAETVVIAGPSGAGHAAKTLNNLLSATNVVAAAEVLSVATRFGIAPDTMIDIVNASTGRSQATEVKFPRHVLTGAYDSSFLMDLMLKDLGIARALADELDIDAPVTAQTIRVARAAREWLGRDDGDHTEVARYHEFRHGVSFRTKEKQ